MPNARLLSLLDELQSYVHAEADREQQLGPTWLADQSAAGLASIREITDAAMNGRFAYNDDFDIAVLLGQSWVNVHPKIDKLIAAINFEVRSGHET